MSHTIDVDFIDHILELVVGRVLTEGSHYDSKLLA